MAASESNPLVSKHKSDSGLHVALHPLVLLTISDYITRHTLRNLKGPVVGGILGQQNGREITAEHAFECKMVGDHIDEAWFKTRLQQSKHFYLLIPFASSSIVSHKER
jgi:COP9 signalosome complex subunit 6